MWLAPDGNSVLYCLSNLSLSKRLRRAPTRDTYQGDGKSSEKEPKLSLSGSVLMSAGGGGGDVEVGFYSVSATVRVVSCVNATVQ